MSAPAASWSIPDIWLTTYSMSLALLTLQCRSQCSPCQTTQSRSVWAKMTSHLRSSCWWLWGSSGQPAALESQLCQGSQGNKHNNELVDTSVSNSTVCDLQIIWEKDNKLCVHMDFDQLLRAWGKHSYFIYGVQILDWRHAVLTKILHSFTHNS